LKGVDLRVPRGSVHALLGENGAGKSTLMKILMGLTRPDAGVMRINGSAVDFHSTGEARDHGVSMIFQELNTVGHLSVADNIFLGREPRIPLFGLIDKGLMRSKAASYLGRLRANISPDDFPCNLSVANTQLIEIAKAVSFNAQIIVMDEPTSALTDREIKELFRIIGE
ncbi:MAG TPA: D-xylose ABC transporter ATP-binding protein, partial [Verrucomicrobia bacterium]|nr:D-xylose ABC transporter ATP-binding protein [Verrucomicrobiota bacterium]